MTASAAPSANISRGAGIGAVALTLLALLGFGVNRTDTAGPDGGTVVRAATLRFEDRPDGSVAVMRAADGVLVHAVPPGGDGFIRGTMRGLNRERARRGLSAEAPFELVQFADGRFELLDRTTDRRIDLHAFGSTNTAAFQQLLAAGEARR